LKYHIETMKKIFYIKIIKILSYLLLIICILANVALIILLERKILDYSQIRKGPNKVVLLVYFSHLMMLLKIFQKKLCYL